MSSKLLGCLQYRLDKVVVQKFKIVWQDNSFQIYVNFYGDEFSDDLNEKLIKQMLEKFLFITVKKSQLLVYLLTI